MSVCFSLHFLCQGCYLRPVCHLAVVRAAAAEDGDIMREKH